jgi:ATP-dependent Clp protease ATP-binding subunit ClpC
VFERFTDRARRVVVLAQEEARILNHNYIGTEHLLLGILHEEDGIGARALTAVGISLPRARAEVEELIGHGKSSPTGHIPFTPRSKKVLELSLREALKLNHNHVGSEHLLLGLLSEGEGVGAQALVKLGAPLPAVRQKVLELVGGAGSGIEDAGYRPAPAEPAVDGPRCPGCRSQLAATLVCRMVTAQGEQGTGDLEVAVVYCKGCGRAMGVLPHSASAAP